MNDLLSHIGARILERRQQMRLTQEELAEKVGVTPQTISAAELGKKALRPENIIGVSAALGISTDYLLLGIISSEDNTILSQKISQLTSVQYRHLEDIIDSFIAALQEKEGQEPY